MPVTLEFEPLDSDPDIEPGAYLTLQRQDGRSLWQQRCVVVRKQGAHYVLKPVDEMHGFQKPKEPPPPDDIRGTSIHGWRFPWLRFGGGKL